MRFKIIGEIVDANNRRRKATQRSLEAATL
jgi:hypothetical protein